MATKIGDMAVYISANTAGLARDLARASHMAGGFAGRLTRQMATAGRSMRSSLGDVFKVAGGNLLSAGIQQAAGSMKGLVASSLDLAGAAEVSAQKFETMLGSAEKATSLIAELKDFAAASPIGLADAQQYAGSLLGVGVSQEQVTPTISRLSDLSGGDSESMKALVRVYGQIKGMGRLQGQDWLQIANTNTLTLEDMAKAMNTDVAGFKRLQEQGRVSFSDVQRAIKSATDEGGRFYQMGEKYALTYTGKLDKLGDSWDELKRYVGQAIIDEMSLKEGADDAGTFLDSLRPFVDMLRPAIKWVGELGRAMAQMAGEGGKAFVEVADIIGGKLARAFPQTIAWIKEMVAGMKEFKLDPQGIADFAAGIGDGIVDAIQWAKPYWDSFVDDFVTPIKDAIQWVVETLADANKFWARAKDRIDGGNRYDRMVKTEAEEKNVRAGMREYGLSEAAAYDLVSWQEVAAGFLAEQVAAEAKLANYDKYRPHVTNPNAELYTKLIPGAKAEIDNALNARTRADDIVQKIIASGDKAKPAADKLSFDAQAIADRRKMRDEAAPKAPAGGSFAIDKMNLDPRLADLANKLKEKLVNPATKFAKDMADLETIRSAGKLDADQFALAAADLVKELGTDIGGPPQLAPAAELASQQLATMVAQAGIGTAPKTVEGLLEILNRTQEQALVLSRRMVEGIDRKPPVINIPE